MKYGVISCAQLVNDLTNWAHLYAAGRLHKPVLFLEKPSGELTDPLAANLHSAVRVSLLQLPEQFTREQLYETISRLSYNGDIRMRVGIGENPNKVTNIVKKNMGQFDALYLPILQNVFQHVLHYDATQAKFQQNVSDTARLEHWQRSPSHLKMMLPKPVTNSAPTAAMVQAAAARIVGRTSLPQTAMGLLSAGPYTATVYALKKVVKSVKGRLK
jgi:translocator assembly and maintenance protein 41